MKTKSLRRAVARAAALALLAGGCAAGPVVFQEHQYAAGPAVSVIGLMPFVKAGRCGDPGQPVTHLLDCPPEKLCYDSGEMQPDADSRLTRIMQDALQSSFGPEAVAAEAAAPAPALIGGGSGRITLRERAQRLGERIGASHVLVGTVWRFRELLGGAHGADRPASVAFAVYLVDAASGRMVWEAAFDKTQQSLMENLLNAPEFFRHGARWRTAEDLARDGAEKILDRAEQAPSAR